MFNALFSRNARFVCCILLSCFILNAAGLYAQELDTSIIERIDTHVEKIMDDLNIPGVAVGIVQDDQIVYLRGYGLADNKGREMTPQTPVVLASLSKSFTGLAIQQLVEAGQLDIDTPVTEILDWFPYDEIRVSHLLYQTSGFTTLSGVSYLADGLRNADALETTMRRTAADYPPVREPGMEFEYSNTNYDLLGLIVQVISDQSYESYIQEKIFTPLGMANSYTSLETAQENGIAQGYVPFFGQMRATDSVYSRGHIASAGLISTAEDLTHYHIAMLNGGHYQDAQIISEEGIVSLHTPGHMLDTWNGYGMGWWHYPFWAGIEDAGLYTAEVPYVIEHLGTASNYLSYQFLLPTKRWGIVVLTNAYDVSRESLYYNLPHGIAEILNGYEVTSYLPAREDFLTKNSYMIGRALFVIWIIMALFALRSILVWRRNPATMPRSILRRVAVITIPVILDIGIVIFMLRVPRLEDATLKVIMAELPELRILTYGLFAVAVGWGTLRTAIFLWLLWNRGNQAQGNTA